MPDMLNRKLTESGGSMSVDDTLLTFPGLAGRAAFIPYIVTQLGINYAQQISRIYGLNMSKVFLVSGRAQGNATLQQILSPGGSLKNFYETYGDVCNAARNLLSFSVRQGCGTQTFGVQRFTAGTCLANTLAIQVGSQDGVVNNSTQISFESLQYAEQ